MSKAQLPIAIIGAGPSGLAAARALQKEGIKFIGFERHSDVGGLWDINNPHSTVYETAHLISSKSTTEFKEFPMSDAVADYPSHRELKKYFTDFAHHFKLDESYRFNQTVESITPREGGGWIVKTPTESTEVSGVVIATGTLHHPNRHPLEQEFKGESLHSSKYKDPEIFKGKRVLIVGGGNSGCDIAVDAVHHAAKVDVSLRRGYHFVPKYIFGKPADTVGKQKMLPAFIQKKVQKAILKTYMGDPVRLGFPRPDHDLFESHPVVNSLILYHAGHGDISIRPDIDKIIDKTVFYKDGSFSEYDLVLWATGYKIHYPFIDKQYLNWQGSCPQLYLNIFHPTRNDVFVVGMVEALGLGWQGRYDQAALVARYIYCQQNAPEKAHAFRRKAKLPIDLSGGMNYIKLDRMSYYVHKDTYNKAINEQLQELR